jgi:polyferredoxin
MILSFVFFLTIGAAFIAPTDMEVAQKIPQELWKRDNVLAGGGWALVVPTCPVGTTSCDWACCPNSLVCQINLDSNWADQACCPDCESHSPLPKS